MLFKDIHRKLYYHLTLSLHYIITKVLSKVFFYYYCQIKYLEFYFYLIQIHYLCRIYLISINKNDNDKSFMLLFYELELFFLNRSLV